ncbi:MAG: CHAT domain-containing protein [Acidobacteriota bacterium]
MPLLPPLITRFPSASLWLGILLFPFILGPEPVRRIASANSFLQSGRLIPGGVIESQLQAGEIQNFLLQLPPDSYAHVLVTQKGVALEATIYNPAGERLASGDRRNRLHGPKHIHLIAGGGGAYRLEIRDAEKTSGAYAVALVDLRAATERDRKLAAAQAIFSEGWRLFQQEKKESNEAAIEKYQAAMALYQEIDEAEGLALTVIEIGQANEKLGRTKEAEEWNARAVPLWQAARDVLGEVRALNNLGVMAMNQSRARAAMDIFNRALPLWRAGGDPNGEARTLLNIGIAFDYLGEPQQTLAFYDLALKTWKVGGDPQGPPWALNGIGQIYTTLGNYDSAVEYHRQAIEIWRALKRPGSEAIGLNGLGEAHLNLGDYPKAIEEFTAAIDIRRRSGDERNLARSLANLGTAFRLTGRNEQAREAYLEAIALARKRDYPWVEAEMLSHLGELAVEASLPVQTEKALGLYRDALALARRHENYQIETLTLYRLAQLEMNRGQLDAARKWIEPALDSYESLRARIANQDLRASFFATGQDYFEFYVDLLMHLHQQQPTAGYERLAWQAQERSRARSLLELLTEARADIRQDASPALLAERQNLRQQIADATNRRLYLLGNGGKSSEAVQADAEINRLTEEYNQAEARIRQHSPRYAALAQPQPAELAAIRKQLDEGTLLLQYALGRQRSYLWVVSRDGVESFVLPPRSEIEAAAQQVDGSIQNWRLRNGESQYWTAAARLSQMILSPLVARLGTQRLVIVPDGALHSVSFSALPLPPQNSAATPRPMIAEHEVSYAPSASVLSALRQQKASDKPGPPKLLVLADPVFSPDDERVRHRTPQPRKRTATKFDMLSGTSRSAATPDGAREVIELRPLSYSQEEAEKIEALAAANSTVARYSFQANREAVIGVPLRQYDILHFATHALIHARRPALSGIVLSLVNEDGSKRDGFLQLHDIYNLDLSAELVVLSACQTARGQEVRGEGVVGLTRGFLYSGAQRVVSSLWSVDDLATKELMTHFYRAHLRQGLRPAAALRQAQLAMWRTRGWQSPYFWGAFTLHGEWK